MTGQIPKYGANFRHERRAYDPMLGSAAYVLKSDAAWVIRSDKTSKRWFVFYEGIPVSGVFGTLTLAMDACLTATAALAGKHNDADCIAGHDVPGQSCVIVRNDGMSLRSA